MMMTPNTPFYNMIISSNFVADGQQKTGFTDDHYTFLKKGEVSKLYMSRYTTNLGFATSSNLKEWKTEEHKYFENQNAYIEKAFGVKNALMTHEFKTTTQNIEYTIDKDGFIDYKFDAKLPKKDVSFTFETVAEADGYYYAYLISNTMDFTITRNEHTYSKNLSEKCVLNFGKVKKGDKLSCVATATDASNTEAKTNYFLVYTTDEKINEVCNKLTQNGMFNIETYEDTYIKTTIDNKSDFVFTNIPYDTCWSVFVDGKQLDAKNIYAVDETFIGFDLNEGIHTIEFKYHFPYLKIGFIISISAFLISILYILYQKKQLICLPEPIVVSETKDTTTTLEPNDIETTDNQENN